MNNVFVLLNEDKTIVACISGNRKGEALKESIQDAIGDHLDTDSLSVSIRTDVGILRGSISESLSPVKFTVKIGGGYKEDYYLTMTAFY